MPVYNPLNFGLLYKILKHKCWSCHRFKGPSEKTRRYVIKLQLLDRGELALAMGLDAELSNRDGASETATESENRKQIVFEKYERFAATTTPKTEEMFGHARQHRKEVVGEILKSFHGSRCENCGAHSPAIRKDGYTKLFQKVREHCVVIGN
jgi:DNA-directed RNA polymerase I subunit RPA1